MNGDSCFNKNLAIGSKGNKKTILKYIEDIKYSSSTKCDYIQGLLGARRYFNHGLTGGKLSWKMADQAKFPSDAIKICILFIF